MVGMSISGMEQWHTMAVVPFQAQKYGQTYQYQPTHLDFRLLVASTRHFNQLQVHVKNSEDLGVPFYILPDVLQTPSIPVLRHRNRYQGQLGSTHSISRRHGDSDLVFSPATNSVTCVEIRSQSLPLNGCKWKEEPSTSKAPRPIKKGVDRPCGLWRVGAPAPWAKRWPARPPNAFASPSVIKRASNRQERRTDGSARAKKVGWVSTLRARTCSKGWERPATKRLGWEPVKPSNRIWPRRKPWSSYQHWWATS